MTSLAGHCADWLRIRDREIKGIFDSYGHRQAGDLVAVGNSSAARNLWTQAGDEIEFDYLD